MVMPGDKYDWKNPYPREKGWQKKGACSGEDPNIYVPPEKQGTKDTIHYDKTICDGCIVRKECLDYALANHPKYGLWSGTTPKQRDKMYRFYRGEREYELDLDRTLFPRKPSVSDFPLECETSEDVKSALRNPLAFDRTIRFSWVKEVYVQCTLFEGF